MHLKQPSERIGTEPRPPGRMAREDERPVVLVIAPTPFFADRGCHVRIYEEVRLLQDLGYRVEVCTYHHGRDMPGVPTARTLEIPWYQELGPGPTWHKLYVDGLLFFRCLQVARRIRPVLIHAHLHEGACIGAVVARLFRIPCVADLQGSLTRELSDYEFGRKIRFLDRLLTRIERWIDRSAHHLVVSSTHLKGDLVQRFAVPEERITEVPDGVGRSFFDEPDGGARARLGISPSHRVVVFVGVLSALQGRDVLLEAMAEVLDAHADVSFVVVGFPGEDECRRVLEGRGHGARAHFLGRVDYLRIAELLADADLAVSPKISETEGNGKLFNYMAGGLATVVFDTPVNREILGEDGLYVETHDARAFAAAIRSALTEDGRRRELGGRLRKRAECHSWARNEAPLLHAYRRAAARAGTPDPVTPLTGNRA